LAERDDLIDGELSEGRVHGRGVYASTLCRKAITSHLEARRERAERPGCAGRRRGERTTFASIGKRVC
ncbi:MAG: hypothetical protein K2Y35_14945, partial [Burkholderiales bacterium]|nr:hypothetical protein [Burkholderiales bacterium]